MSFTEKNVPLNLFLEVWDQAQNVFGKNFQSRTALAALLKISARLRRRTRLNGRLATQGLAEGQEKLKS